jgi:hypothetical protein
MRDAVSHPGDVGKDPAGRPARRAEGGRELNERRPLAERVSKLTARQHLARLARTRQLNALPRIDT